MGKRRVGETDRPSTSSLENAGTVSNRVFQKNVNCLNLLTKFITYTGMKIGVWRSKQQLLENALNWPTWHVLV
jgi:hypothetical protein